MNPRSLLWGVRLLLVLALFYPSVWSKDHQPEITTVVLSVFDDAGVSPKLVSQSEAVTSRIFAQAGVRLLWLRCGLPSLTEPQRDLCTSSVFPTHLHLRLIRHPLQSQGSALGVSYLADDGVGFQADIFCDRVAHLHDDSEIDLTILLGVVMAHELGHLLLGTSSHSPQGLMRASWTREDLRRAFRCALLFSDDESDHMRAKLYQAYLEQKRDRLLLSSHN